MTATDEAIEAMARAICEASGFDPEDLEPGDDAYRDNSCVFDAFLPNGERAFRMWRLYDEHARAAYAAAFPFIRERMAKRLDPKGPRPCDCDRRYCDKAQDAAEVSAWDEQQTNATAIRELQP
jgi:hypothetical protein